MKLTIVDPRNERRVNKDPYNPSRIFLELEASSVRDEYHSMHELYNHRCVIFAALLKAVNLPVYKTPIKDGWFVAGVILPSGQVGYHLPDHLHHYIQATTKTPEYDGHTSPDAIHRLMNYLRPSDGTESPE